jgi:hypothetical protein
MEPITVETIHGRFPIVPKWRGRNIAVHRYIVSNYGDGPILSSQPKQWQVTHVATGKAMASWRLWGCTLELVVQLAAAWDDAIGKIDADKAREWKLHDQWISACSIARSNGIAALPRPRKK